MPRAGPSPALDVDQLRADTGAVGHLTYFNNARQSPPPRPALDAVHACLTRAASGRHRPPAAQLREPCVYRLAETIDRFEGGDYPHALVTGLRASAEYAAGVGLHAIAQRNGELGRYARSALQSAGATVLDAAHGSTGTVPFRLPHMSPDAVVRRLSKRGVETCVISEDSNRSGLRGLGTPDLVRLSLHYFNTMTEIDETVALLGERTAWPRCDKNIARCELALRG